jgi:polysaccharide biosynthesis protein PslH
LKILIITPRIPFPPYRGDKLKIFNVVKQLQKNNVVSVITFLRKKKQLDEIEELKKLNFNILYIKISFLESILNVIISFFNRVPLQVAWYKSKKMKQKVSQLINSGEYDVAYFHLIRSAQYFPETSNKNSVLKVIDFTDAVSLYLNRFFSIEKNIFKKIFLGIERKRIEQYETVANKFDSVFICSEVDREYLRQKGIGTRMKILRNGVDTQNFETEKQDYDQNRIIFTGNMPYYANYDAAIYFSKEIFPLVLKEVPNAKFYIVGQDPPLRVRSLACDNIIVTGFVKDIKLEYLRSNINVAPMRFGAGTLNKIIESLVLGVPVISTPIAVEGFPEEIKKNIIVASGSREFADSVIRYLKDPELRQQFMEKDKSIIKEMLSWENIVKQFENDLKEEIRKLDY